MTERKPLIAVLTGAGISTDSGIPDFRGPNGEWTKDPERERLSTLRHYLASSDIRKRAWQSRKDSPAWQARPNAAHLALAELERAGVAVRVITQNIDGLHQKAGLSERKVLELHGNMFGVRCVECGLRSEMAEALRRVEAGEADPACQECGGILKASTIMFGEALDGPTMDMAERVAMASSQFWAIGTSLRVEPAAGLCVLAVQAGAELTIVNADPTPYDYLARRVIQEPIGEAVPRLVRQVLTG